MAEFCCFLFCFDFVLFAFHLVIHSQYVWFLESDIGYQLFFWFVWIKVEFLFFSKRRLIMGFYYSHVKYINDCLLNWIIWYVGKTLCYNFKVKADNHDLQFFGSGGILYHITLIQVHTIVELLFQIWLISMEMAFDTGMMVVKSNFW